MTDTPPLSTETIPDFQLPASTGHTLSLDSFLDKVPLVLVFLPQLHSPECASLLAELDRRHKDFGSELSQLLVIATETARTVRDFSDERDLSVPILADAGGAMFRDFSVDREGNPVAVVADRSGTLKRRFDPFFEGSEPEEAVTSLLYTVRAIGSDYLDEA